MSRNRAADPLKALLRGLQEHQGSWLSPTELAELLWLAQGLPSAVPAHASSGPSKEPAPKPPEPTELEFDPGPAPPTNGPSAGLFVDDALREALPSFFPEQPPRPQGRKHSGAKLLPDQVLPREADLRAVLPIRLQDVRLIPDPKPFQAALQSLAAAEPAPPDPRHHHRLDEVLTVEAYARSQRLWPVFSPSREPRLSLVLLVDGGLSMQVWHRLADEWLALLMRSAMVRDVRAVPLDPTRPMAVLGALAGAAEEQVVLLLSDCSGRHWWNGGALHALLRMLAERGPMALLQVLPDWMWRRTALGVGTLVAVRNRQPLAPNRLYQRYPLQTCEPPPPRGGSHLVVPLLRLQATDLDQWCSLVLGRGHDAVTAACLPVAWPALQITSRAAEGNETVEEQARRRLAKYVQRCSGPAERLLRVMAAAPVLTLPVMRLLQEAMVKDGGPLAMAELLLSGLLRRRDGLTSDGPHLPPLVMGMAGRRAADRVQFDFEPPSLRSALLDTLPCPETAEVVQRVSELIEHRWEMCDGVPPFQAFLADPTLLANDPSLAAMEAFATVTAEIIERLPGPGFQQLARRLRHGSGGAKSDPFPSSLFAFEEIQATSAVLLRLPQAETLEDYVTAQWVDLPMDDYWFETATLQQGKVCKTRLKTQCFWEVLQPANYNDPESSAGGSAALESTARVLLSMLQIPPGSFQMGSPPDEEGRSNDEGPQHEVTLEAFFLSHTPITQAQWRAVAEWQRREDEDPELWPETLDPDPVAKLAGADGFLGERRPVVNVSWNDAMAFCQRLRLRTGKNYTLPSEAQWEYACRAGTTTPFHFGETISTEVANYDGRSTYGSEKAEEHAVTEQRHEEKPRTGTGDQSQTKNVFRRQTTDVGIFPANVWGLHDMHGNVWEWCHDNWHGNYQGAPVDGAPWIDETTDENKRKLLRGGSWISPPRDCRSASRNRSRPSNRSSFIGFRVCCLPQDLILYP